MRLHKHDLYANILEGMRDSQDKLWEGWPLGHNLANPVSQEETLNMQNLKIWKSEKRCGLVKSAEITGLTAVMV